MRADGANGCVPVLMLLLILSLGAATLAALVLGEFAYSLAIFLVQLVAIILFATVENW